VRVLVTGSRKWTNSQLIYDVMLDLHMNATSQPVLVSGHCPDGADAIAEAIAGYLKWPVERHPADWIGLGKRAGFDRNAEMVEAGADVCIAFIKNKSRGATMTADLAHKAGIPLKVYRSNDGGTPDWEELTERQGEE
jgi:hypothetical protein